jgi:AraC family transcriptional regulator
MSHQKRSLTGIALEVGFNSSSDFSRSFKAHFGVSPRKFDLAKWRATHAAQLPQPAQSTGNFEVRVRDLPARRVAYSRVLRPYEPGRVRGAVLKMVDWAKSRGLERGQWLGYQWEEADLVPLDRCRYDIGVEVPDDVVLGDDVSEQRFPAMKVVELPMKGDVELETRAFNWLYGVWLPRSGYSPGHQPAFEAFDGLPYAHGDTHFELRIHLAIER